MYAFILRIPYFFPMHKLQRQKDVKTNRISNITQVFYNLIIVILINDIYICNNPNTIKIKQVIQLWNITKPTTTKAEKLKQ